MDTIVTLLLSALIPLVVGFLWYNKMTFGNFWMRVSGVSEDKLKTGNIALIFLLTYVLGFFMSASMLEIVIHQYNVYSIFADTVGADDPNSEIGRYIADFMANYGNNFRTFKHGAFHGASLAIFFVTPIIWIMSMFERRGFKYVMVHAGFWIITLSLMGGTLCAFCG